MSSRRAAGALAALLAALVAGPAQAQESRGRVQGVVSDAGGGVIPGARVVLTNDGTQVAVARTSNRDGRFLFDYVDPGTYSLRVELDGFKPTLQKNLLVQQRADITVDVKLE